ncbi:hypothetical protein BGW80DRAFT_1345229 [Lactifluus volemus]|nr:hypothetical protein BGW80DRAFT_1345229 [Lactifluus volemus]
MVSLSKLTRFRYSGDEEFFEALIARLAAPSLEDIHIVITHTTPSMILHLTRFLNGAHGQFSTAQLIDRENSISLSLLTDSPLLDTSKPNFILDINRHPHHDLMKIIVAFSARLSTVEVLLLRFFPSKFRLSQLPEYPIPWDSFFLPFCSVKTLTVHPKLVPDVAHSLLPGHGPDILPVLEGIELLKPCWGYILDPNELAESARASMVNAFQPFVASRQQARRSVTVSWKVFSYQS